MFTQTSFLAFPRMQHPEVQQILIKVFDKDN